MWIVVISTEVIGVLKTLGKICNLSDGILGLTFFAVGNSIGDLVGNLCTARIGFPKMAIGASLGAPMLNCYISVGLAALVLCASTGSNVELTITQNLWITIFGLIILILLLGTSVSMAGFKLYRIHGIMFVTMYFLVMFAGILTEVLNFS
jgi:Ca2+/Na+ antiporter